MLGLWAFGPYLWTSVCLATLNTNWLTFSISRILNANLSLTQHAVALPMTYFTFKSDSDSGICHWSSHKRERKWGSPLLLVLLESRKASTLICSSASNVLEQICCQKKGCQQKWVFKECTVGKKNKIQTQQPPRRAQINKSARILILKDEVVFKVVLYKTAYRTPHQSDTLVEKQ